MCLLTDVLFVAPLAAAVPAWVWAALVMAGFVLLTALTMWLARLPVERKPPPVELPNDHTPGDAND